MLDTAEITEREERKYALWSEYIEQFRRETSYGDEEAMTYFEFLDYLGLE